MNQKPKVLITGIAGFIGFHLAHKLKNDFKLLGIDLTDKNAGNINADRLNELPEEVEYQKIDIRKYSDVKTVIENFKPDLVIHLAACTGISASSIDPKLYFETNVNGFYNILESCRLSNVSKIIFASSSSVYNTGEPVFFEGDCGDNQLSFYGTTKRIDEILASNFAQQFSMTCVGLRFFTVYGSWVRKDMAGWKFMNAVSNGETVTLYNGGEVSRDFTHVSDIVKSVNFLAKKILKEKGKLNADIYNIGYGSPVSVNNYLSEICMNLGKEAMIENADLPGNELERTHADTSLLESETQYKPQVDVKEGVKEMVSWYLNYYNK